MDAGDAEARRVEPSTLLHASDPDSRDRAWASFTRTHSDLVLRALHSLAVDHDAKMDLYTHVLDELRRDDFRRLRSYPGRGAGRFPIWLAVVVRRLAVDHLRHVYGRRSTPGIEGAEVGRATRKRLVDLLGEEIEIGAIADPSARNPEIDLRARELQDALSSAVAELEERDLLLLKLRFEDDLSAREVAGLLQLPTIFHVYRRQNSILGSLRERLEKRGFRDSSP